jgi:DNA adenine methylase
MSSLEGAVFVCSDYSELKVPKNSIIYCDIPYQGTKQYATSKNFDYNKFWQWCRKMNKAGHEIYVSEHSAPPDFECIWEKKTTNSLNTKNTYRHVEKLFTLAKK